MTNLDATDSKNLRDIVSRCGIANVLSAIAQDVRESLFGESPDHQLTSPRCKLANRLEIAATVAEANAL